MSETYQEMKARETGHLPRVDALVSSGVSPFEAINRVCTDVHSYNEAMKKYGLKPVLHD